MSNVKETIVTDKPAGRMATLAAALAAVAMLGGCATSGNPKDPIEGFNRAMFSFNEGVDKVALKPVAQGYEAALPTPLRTGVSNFFGNVADVFIAVNNLLQGKPGDAASDVGRVLVNSTIGILGLFDVASDLGMEKHDEDFGQTFGRWGVGDGAYVVLPLLGPHTARDVVGEVLDIQADPVAKVDHVETRNILLVTRVIRDRAAQLPADKLIEEAALDKYSYIRDAYLQRRHYKIYDGNPPREPDASVAPRPRPEASLAAGEPSSAAAAPNPVDAASAPSTATIGPSLVQHPSGQ
jgi:phospholipid-binding lipoprotein MlaA